MLISVGIPFLTVVLFRYIAPEDIPIQYGGFKREVDEEFSDENGQVSEVTLRAGCTEILEFYIAKVIGFSPIYMKGTRCNFFSLI
jgi:hypothetical protein